MVHIKWTYSYHTDKQAMDWCDKIWWWYWYDKMHLYAVLLLRVEEDNFKHQVDSNHLSWVTLQIQQHTYDCIILVGQLEQNGNENYYNLCTSIYKHMELIQVVDWFDLPHFHTLVIGDLQRLPPYKQSLFCYSGNSKNKVRLTLFSANIKGGFPSKLLKSDL